MFLGLERKEIHKIIEFSSITHLVDTAQHEMDLKSLKETVYLNLDQFLYLRI